MSDYPEEVRALVDRLAAAFMRGDIECARELVDDERVGWEEVGRDKEVADRRKAEAVRLECEGHANAVFITKDNLEVMQDIGGFHYPPQVWKRPMSKGHLAAINGAQFTFEHAPIRQYYYDGVRRDGLPVYREE